MTNPVQPQEGEWEARLEELMTISDYLLHKENWTPTLRYVHRSRLIIGFVLGFIFANLI